MLKSLGSGSVNPFESLALVLFNARTGHIEPSGRELSLWITLLTCHFIPKGSPTVILLYSISILIVGTYILLALKMSPLSSFQPPLVSLYVVFFSSLTQVKCIGSVNL